MIAFDLPLGFESQNADTVAAAAEADGVDGVWSVEAGHDPYLPLALAARATSTLTIGSAIAVAFPRTPMVHAQVAWDLHRMAPGRFILGLGAQVKAHNDRRYSAPYDRPIGRLRDMVRAIRAIWECWQEGGPLKYEGEFYKHTLMTPFFNPGPVEADAPPPIYLAAVTEAMLTMAGAEADGIHVHPLCTEASLDKLTLHHARTAAAAAGRDPASLGFVVAAMLATGKTMDDAVAAREPMRSQVAFYGSTPAYRQILEIEGQGELADKLHALSRTGGWGEMHSLVSDELLDKFCVTATWDDLPEALVERYKGRATRLMPYAVADDGTPWKAIAKAVREGSA